MHGGFISNFLRYLNTFRKHLILFHTFLFSWFVIDLSFQNSSGNLGFCNFKRFFLFSVFNVLIGPCKKSRLILYHLGQNKLSSMFKIVHNWNSLNFLNKRVSRFKHDFKWNQYHFSLKNSKCCDTFCSLLYMYSSYSKKSNMIQLRDVFIYERNTWFWLLQLRGDSTT